MICINKRQTAGFNKQEDIVLLPESYLTLINLFPPQLNHSLFSFYISFLFVGSLTDDEKSLVTSAVLMSVVDWQRSLLL